MSQICNIQKVVSVAIKNVEDVRNLVFSQTNRGKKFVKKSVARICDVVKEVVLQLVEVMQGNDVIRVCFCF